MEWSRGMPDGNRAAARAPAFRDKIQSCMQTPKHLTFDPVEIQRLFGHEAADDETPERLKEYYVKNITYKEVTAPLPIRILVGHKGIGKSALFTIAILEAKRPRAATSYGRGTQPHTAVVAD